MHLAGRGARHLLLVSRRGSDAPGAGELQDRLERLGAQVTIAACDTADYQALADVLDTIPAALPLTAVIHTAGTVDDGVLTALTPQRLDSVLRAKVDAAVNLHHLTAHLPLTRFTLFSSSSGVFGAPGQANYAAANTFLDALAHHRHHHRQPAQALAWGLWESTSTITSHLDDTDRRRLQRSGINALTDDQALTLLDTTHTHHHAPLLIPIHLNPAALNRQATQGTLHPLLTHLTPTPHSTSTSTSTGLPATAATGAGAGAGVGSGSGAGAGGAGGGLGEELAGLGEAECLARLVEIVRVHAAAVLGHSRPGTIAGDRPFNGQGFDSLTAVELRNRLTAVTNLALPATALF
ncbi:type I polyketide synthase, partial [Streptomyces sp. NPDC018031]|uniref:type I polyketide synthase n=1 Tax=Streptomyces sp. NPDC018031 TaxID=3365033 RepID=UPI00379F312F